MRIATVGQMREIERRASEEFGIPERVLMERAADALLEVVRTMVPVNGRIAVFCGKGNNGGDGLALGRLAHEAGYLVQCFVAAAEHELSGLSLEVLRAAHAHGVPIRFLTEPFAATPIQADLVVDALLGTGARGEITGLTRQTILAINSAGLQVLAVDVPSGIESDTGRSLGTRVRATRTLTFGMSKRFSILGDGIEAGGLVLFHPIGLPNALLGESTGVRITEEDWVARRLPTRERDSNKGRNGRVLIVAGSKNMRGAAILAADAALRMGAGLVTVASVGEVCDAVAAALPEAILAVLPEQSGAIAPEASEILLENQEKYDVAAFGPGMTHGPSVQAFLGRVWAAWSHPCVIDADALNCVSLGVELPVGACVLTPHPGEMARLIRKDIGAIQSDRFGALQACLNRFGKTALLKGAATLIGAGGEEVLVNPTGNSGLATGGTGDVLTGAIAALMGQRLHAYDAAACGAYCHGMAAELCSLKISSIGYRASEVAEALPRVRDTMLKTCNPNH